MPRGVRLSFLSLLLVFSASIVVAQSTTSLRGVVTDAKGALLPGAVVKINDPQTGFARTVTSGQDGVYQFLQIPPAKYSVNVTATGFAAIQRENLTLQVNTPATVNFTMQVEGTNVKIEVTDQAPLVNTQDASIGNTFNERQLRMLPSEGRDPAAILSLQPGVTFIGSDKQIDQYNDSRGGSVSGARSDQTNITLDGLDDNEQLYSFAFQGALRTTEDSIEEFRVTTSNGNADEGRSSGGQVSLITKSGTNAFHGTMYDYNRTSLGEANDWFNKQAELASGLPNKPGHLIRNTFGATFGGPIKKDRLFFFFAYEGQRKRETTQVTQTVPSEELKAGIIQYVCDTSTVNGSPGGPLNDPNCVVGSNANYNVISDPRAGNNDQGTPNLIVQLSQGGFAALDPNCTGNGTCPLGPGANPAVLQMFSGYPKSNSDSVGDLLNYRGYTFAGANPEKLNTYIVRLDYKITPNGNHNLFLRGNLQNDNQQQAPQFPGQPSTDFHTSNNKGIAAGYTALIRPTLINNFRWSLVREGVGDSGINSQPYVNLRTLSDPQGFAFQSEYVNVPVHNFVDDLTWTKGKHTLQFGTNWRFVRNNRSGNGQNVSYAVADPFSLDTNAGIANQGGSLDPSISGSLGLPDYPLVNDSFGELYDFSAMGLAGVVTVSNVIFNQNKAGVQVPEGDLVSRRFKSWEAEWYAQDAWRVTPHLVITAGLRYSLLQPPFEANGDQAAPTISVGNLFAQRAAAQLQGKAYSPGADGGPPAVTFGLSGQGNGKQPYWDWDYKNFAPRLALAYSPNYDHGLLHKVFGTAGKSSVRMGYGLYFDHFGEGIVNTFDRNGSFGLTTYETNPYGIQDVDCAFRFSGVHDLPEGQYCGQEMSGVAPGPFPVTPPSGVNAPGGFAIYWGMDDKLKTPYSHVFNFSFTRDLGHSFSLEASYVGRLGRHLLQETDLGMPEDVVDPTSHTDYFSAATTLSKLARAGTAISDVNTTNAGTYWENLFPAAAGVASSQLYSFSCPGIPLGTVHSNTMLTATQAMYDTFACNVGDEIVALQYADTPSFDPTGATCFPACSTLPGQAGPTPYNFFMPQFSSLWGWRSSGTSAYHAMNLTLRRALSKGIQFDVNYTFSKSIDVGSNAERVNVFDTVGGFSSQVINAWAPNQLRAVSDFDMRHQINSNWVIDLPFGRGKAFGSGMGRVADAIFGGWTVTGIFHWSSGLPFSVFPGDGWATNYNLTGQAVEIGDPGKVGVYRNAQGNPTMFANTNTAIGAFRDPFPGEGGQRNELRGPGYFGIDAGVDKEWKIKEGQTVSFAWEAFNVTNAVRFDAALSSNNFDLTSSTNFGVYSNTLTQPRVMQFMLRYSF